MPEMRPLTNGIDKDRNMKPKHSRFESRDRARGSAKRARVWNPENNASENTLALASQ